MITRHRIFTALAALLVLFGFAFGPAGAQPAAASQTSYTISAAHSFHNLDVQGGSTADGTPIIQWYQSYSSYPSIVPNQIWFFDAVPGAYDTYYIRSVKSGKVLSVQRYTAGDPVVQLTNLGAASQQWHQEQVGAAYKYRNVATGLYLDVSGGSLAAGAPLIQWYQTSGLNQQFYLTKLV